MLLTFLIKKPAIECVFIAVTIKKVNDAQPTANHFINECSHCANKYAPRTPKHWKNMEKSCVK